MKKYAHIIGAFFYILWGILHIIIGGLLLYKLSNDNLDAALTIIGINIGSAEISQTITNINVAILKQYSWNILWIGLFGLIVGITLNIKNSRIGYLLNLSVISVVNFGFIFILAAHGHINSNGIFGHALWSFAVFFSTLGFFKKYELQVTP